ncbi:MAG TPA: glycosyltransferase [Candidatus Paceibacterota bacterium]|nr:glycosyltransferase [Candidatus Paceibacterota bacterium]
MASIRAFYRAYRNKVSNKLWGVVRVPAVGPKKGYALLSYLVSPFTQTPRERHTDPHASYWECAEIAKLLSLRGYEVDVIDWRDERFVPKKPYALCIDIQRNLERLAPLLPQRCTKVFHLVSSYPEFQNSAEGRRLDDLKRRRGVSLPAHRRERVSLAPRFADHIEGFGNRTVHATYARFAKKIAPIRESVAQEFDFPASKDFETAKRSFLWFGGGGAVHKGLDLVLEAFAQMPDLRLHVVGPVHKEAEFMKEYARELALPNVTLYERPRFDGRGRMTVGDRLFSEVAGRCGAIVYLSCSEGTSGAVVQAMHAGLYPIITPETGIYEDAPAAVIEQPTVEAVVTAIRSFSALPAAEAERLGRTAWSYAKATYSKDQFTKTYSAFLDTIQLP